ncbi:TPA: hypothetical protein JS274_004968, partial [Escherichia coli]|nr:hypothetical protein [Escherichia coli]
MPMYVPVTSSRETGRETVRAFSSWFSQVQRQQAVVMSTVPVMDEPPVCTLTKATGLSG